jgi:hypothetical protein
MKEERGERSSAAAQSLQANQPSAGGAATIESLVNATPAERAELAALTNLAERIKRLLPAVLPAPAFRARLRDGVTLAAHHQETHRALVEGEAHPNLAQWGWLLGAAAIGSAAGLIAVLLRVRQKRNASAS